MPFTQCAHCIDFNLCAQSAHARPQALICLDLAGALAASQEEEEGFGEMSMEEGTLSGQEGSALTSGEGGSAVLSIDDEEGWQDTRKRSGGLFWDQVPTTAGSDADEDDPAMLESTEGGKDEWLPFDDQFMTTYADEGEGQGQGPNILDTHELISVNGTDGTVAVIVPRDAHTDTPSYVYVAPESGLYKEANRSRALEDVSDIIYVGGTITDSHTQKSTEVPWRRRRVIRHAKLRFCFRGRLQIQAEIYDTVGRER